MSNTRTRNDSCRHRTFSSFILPMLMIAITRSHFITSHRLASQFRHLPIIVVHRQDGKLFESTKEFTSTVDLEILFQLLKLLKLFFQQFRLLFGFFLHLFLLALRHVGRAGGLKFFRRCAHCNRKKRHGIKRRQGTAMGQ